MGRDVLRAIDFSGPDGGARINAALEQANASDGVRRVVVVSCDGPDAGGVWSISTSIRVPSGTTLVLEGCVLRLADGANCPIIVNRDRDHGDSDIAVIGVGAARLDGNPNNQARTRRGRDVEIWMEERGLPVSLATREAIGELSVAEFEERHSLPGETLVEMMFGACGIDFLRVDRLQVSNLDVGPTNLFGIHVVGCNDVVIQDIRFLQDGSQPNQDGIGVFGPAERIRISGISGTCGDDAVGLHSFHPYYGAASITGVSISNVLVRNRWNSGLIRTEGNGAIRGVVATNLTMLDGEGYSEGHSAIKLGATRRSLYTDIIGPSGIAEDQAALRDVQLHGVSVVDWVGPVIAVYQSVENLLISGVTGSHTGPLFANFESPIDGMQISNVSTRMTSQPVGEPYVGGMLEFAFQTCGLPQSIDPTERIAVILDGDDVTGVTFSNVRVVLDPQVRAEALELGFRTAGLVNRTVGGGSLTTNSLDFPGFDE